VRPQGGGGGCAQSSRKRGLYARDGCLTMRLDAAAASWAHTAHLRIPCTCARKKIGAAAVRIDACHKKFPPQLRRKISQRLRRCSAPCKPRWLIQTGALSVPRKRDLSCALATVFEPEIFTYVRHSVLLRHLYHLPSYQSSQIVDPVQGGPERLVPVKGRTIFILYTV